MLSISALRFNLCPSHVAELVRLLDRGRPHPPEEGKEDGEERQEEEGEVARLFREMLAAMDARTAPRADGARAADLIKKVRTNGQCSPRHQMHYEPSFLESNDML
jgi:hypothetical protein